MRLQDLFGGGFTLADLSAKQGVSNTPPKNQNTYFSNLLKRVESIKLVAAKSTPIEIPSELHFKSGDVYKTLPLLFKQEGIKAKITSGKRDTPIGKAGSHSHHLTGNAVDIVPDGITFAELHNQLLHSDAFRNYLKEGSLGVLDETDSEMLRKTGGTGAHFHIGPDKIAVQQWNKKLADSQKELWVTSTYKSFLKALEGKDNKEDLARFMTYQAALESGYGTHGGTQNNFGGHLTTSGDLISYNDLDDFTNSHIQLVDKKWNSLASKSLQDYIYSLFQGKQNYVVGMSPDEYYKRVAGTSKTIDKILNTWNVI